MNAKKFSDAMSELDTKYVDEALNYKKRMKKPVWVKWGAMTACIAAVLAVSTFLVNYQRNKIALSDASANVTACYTNNPFIFKGSSESLTGLTEEELFTCYDTAIFRGTVLEIRNIILNFNGDKEYRAIAKIEVEKVYRGPCSEGDTVSVMLPCPIAKGFWVTDTSTVSAMKAGNAGIFMPVIYDDENSVLEQNGAKLDKRDLADYGFADGERYAFLETDNGLVFNKDAYRSIADAANLDEVGDYIETMLERLNDQETEE